MPLAGVLTSQVLDSARTHLNDDELSIWTDSRLLPKLQEAHRELVSELQLAGLPVIVAQTLSFLVPAVPTDGQILDLSTVAGYPNNMILPIAMKEQQPGQMFNDYQDMIECDFLPDVDKTNYLQYWCWQQQKIFVLGALSNINAQLRYQSSINTPITVNDPIGFILGETYLSYRTAALASASIKDSERHSILTSIAERNLDRVVRANIKQEQNLPARRRPYHRGFNSGANQSLSASPNVTLSNPPGPIGWYDVPLINTNYVPNLTMGDTQNIVLNSSGLNIAIPILAVPYGNFRIIIKQGSGSGNQVTMDPSYTNVNPATFDTSFGLSIILTFVIHDILTFVCVAQDSFNTTPSV